MKVWRPKFLKLPTAFIFTLAFAATFTLEGAPPAMDSSYRKLAGDHAEVWKPQATDQKQQAAPGGLIWKSVSGQPKAVILCLHGIQTHAAWFGPLGEEMRQHGFTVIAVDRRGSGLHKCAPYTEGYTNGSGELLGDLEVQIKAARLEAKGAPVYLVGTSWGSNLAGAYVADTKRSQPDGLIQLVPATVVRKPFAPSFGRQVFGHVVNLFAPGVKQQVPFGSIHYEAGRNQEQWREDEKARTGQFPKDLPAVPRKAKETLEPDAPASLKKADNEISRVLTADSVLLLEKPAVRTQMTGLKLGKKWMAGAAHLRCGFPVLVITADRDMIMDSKGARDVFTASQQSSPDITLDSLPAAHGMQLTEAPAISQKIQQWMKKLLDQEKRPLCECPSLHA